MNPPDPDSAPTFDECEEAGVDGTGRFIGTTHADDFRIDPAFRLVATFPLSGRMSDAYTIWIWQEGTPKEGYAVCDNYGFNFAGSVRFDEALNLCLRNCGWATRAHPATEEELTR